MEVFLMASLSVYLLQIGRMLLLILTWGMKFLRSIWKGAKAVWTVFIALHSIMNGATDAVLISLKGILRSTKK